MNRNKHPLIANANRSSNIFISPPSPLKWLSAFQIALLTPNRNVYTYGKVLRHYADTHSSNQQVENSKPPLIEYYLQ